MCVYTVTNPMIYSIWEWWCVCVLCCCRPGLGPAPVGTQAPGWVALPASSAGAVPRRGVPAHQPAHALDEHTERPAARERRVRARRVSRLRARLHGERAARRLRRHRVPVALGHTRHRRQAHLRLRLRAARQPEPRPALRRARAK